MRRSGSRYPKTDGARGAAQEAPAERLGRFRQRFVARFFLRFHMAVILGGAFFAGVIANVVLFYGGVRELAWRYPLAVVAAYAAFFALIRLWLAFVASSPSRADSSSSGPDLADLLSAVPDGSGGVSFGGGGASGASGGFSGGGGGASGGAGADWSDDGSPAVLQAQLAQLQANPGLAPGLASAGGDAKGGGGGGASLDVGDGEGAVLVIVFGLFAAAIFGAGIYLVYDAPDILSDAALQLALASGLWRGSRQLLTPGWATGVLRKTCVPFGIVLVLAAIAGSVAGNLCPRATRLSEVYHLCVEKR
jgi:hypothetical protein